MTISNEDLLQKYKYSLLHNTNDMGMLYSEILVRMTNDSGGYLLHYKDRLGYRVTIPNIYKSIELIKTDIINVINYYDLVGIYPDYYISNGNVNLSVLEYSQDKNPDNKTVFRHCRKGFYKNWEDMFY